MRSLVLTFLYLFVARSTALSVGSRIIGGTTANAGEFPFAAGITINTADGHYFCGGALLSDEWVVTGGQCVNGALTFTIQLGGIHLEATEATSLIVAAEEWVLHPGFSATTLENDIGLIKLRQPITFTDYIQPIELPTAELASFSVVVAIGWGQTTDEEAGLVDTLNRVSLTVLSNEECRLTFGTQITDGMVCVNGNYNEGTCLGDSGGPLIQYVHGTAATAVGVSSFYSGNGCESTDPSGFTRTFPVVDWIRNTTGIA